MKNLIRILPFAAIAAVIASPALAQGGPPWATPAVPTVQAVTESEAQWLRHMREEEKLARDVYQLLYEKWNLAIFRNIASSEGAHFKAVGTLLTRYSVSDPAATTAAGIFADAKLAALYQQLRAKGLLSVKDALEVGVLIEKTDIADLETALKSTAKLDVKRVYTNLLNASFNHLEAFENTCEALAPAPPR